MGTKLRFGVGILVSIMALTVYILTLAPTVTFIDSGELTAVCATLGIAHPTGYPLYTLIGRLFLILPLSTDKAFQLNLLSALFAALTVFFMYLLMCHLMGYRGGGTHTSAPGKIPRPLILCIAAASALLLGYSQTFWAQALVTEVYSLHAFFIAAVTLCVLKAKGGGQADEEQSTGFYVLFAFLFGLGMANHMTLIVLAPACVYLLVAREGLKRLATFTFPVLFPPFLLGLSVYLYLPIRSAVQPVLDWGNPETVGNLLRHLSGKQYQVWMFSSLDIATKQLALFFATFPGQFGPFFIPVAMVGLWRLYRRERRILWFTVSVFVVDLLYAINYDIHDIESYFLPCYVMTAIWIGLGLAQVYEALKGRFIIFQYTFTGLILFTPLVPLWSHYDKADRSKEYFVHDYTHNLLKGVDREGIIISRQWDFFCSPLYYFQYVGGVRPDVVLIEQELLRRSWYYPQLRRQYPWLLQTSQEEVSEFLNELEKFEKDEPYDPVTIQNNYTGMIDSFILNSIDSRPVYVTPEVEGSIGLKYAKVPEGLAHRLHRDRQFHPLPKLEFRYRGLHDRTYDDYFHTTVISLYTNMWTSRGLYYSQHNHCAEALQFFREAIWVDPKNEAAHRELKRCEAILKSGHRSETP